MMLEYFGDYLSFIVLGVIIFICFYYLMVIINTHHEEIMRQREQAYLSFYENADDNFDESSNTEEG